MIIIIIIILLIKLTHQYILFFFIILSFISNVIALFTYLHLYFNQVHVAYDKEGNKYAVKVQHESLKQGAKG